MRIGMILDEEFPPDARVENEALSLINSGFEVYLFSLFFSKNPYKINENINDIRIIRFYVPKFVRKLSALAYSIPFYHLILKSKIKIFLNDNNIDIIHIHDIRVARSVFWIKKNKRPVIIDLHENRPEIMKYYSWVNSFPGKYIVNLKRWKKYEHKYIIRADKVIVVTKEAKKYYLKRVNINFQKIVTVPNTVRKEFYTSYFDDKNVVQKYEKNFSLLYLGDTGIRRGLQTVIKSLPGLIKKIPNIKLIIVGKSKDDYTLLKLSSDLKLNSYIDFEGWKDFSLFQSYISASSIGISPIKRNIHHDTTYANKIFQYMAFGKPILVSDCPPQVNIVEKYNCGLVFKAEDEENFAEQILKLYGDKQLRETMGINGKNAISMKLNWDIQSKELIETYNKINDDTKK